MTVIGDVFDSLRLMSLLQLLLAFVACIGYSLPRARSCRRHGCAVSPVRRLS